MIPEVAPVALAGPESSSEAETGVRPRRVLIVDDSAAARLFLRFVLEDSRLFSVAGEAKDGESAVERAKTLQPDIVLLDLSMPAMDGAEALDDLLRVAPKTKVVILSGMDGMVAGPLIAAGATAFVPKGLTPAELIGQLLSVQC